MPTATAFVVTQRPQRYIKQLVSHFGNKVGTRSPIRAAGWSSTSGAVTSMPRQVASN